MRPQNVDARFTRKAQRDNERTQERYDRNRRVTRRGQRVREAERLVVQVTQVWSV